MSYTGIPIEIGPSRRCGDEALDLARMRSIDDLFNGCLTEVSMPSKGWSWTVDSFPFLHSVLAANHCLRSTVEFAVNVGEGLEIHGLQEDRNGAAFNVKFMVGDRISSEQSMVTSQLIVALSGIAVDLSRSIAAAGIDVSEALGKFPPALFPFQDLAG